MQVTVLADLFPRGVNSGRLRLVAIFSVRNRMGACFAHLTRRLHLVAIASRDAKLFIHAMRSRFMSRGVTGGKLSNSRVLPCIARQGRTPLVLRGAPGQTSSVWRGHVPRGVDAGLSTEQESKRDELGLSRDLLRKSPLGLEGICRLDRAGLSALSGQLWITRHVTPHGRRMLAATGSLTLFGPISSSPDRNYLNSRRRG